jgi:hypothetical protein
MLEITLWEVQTYLWLPVQADTRMQSILDWVNEKVESNVWDLSLWEKIMTVKNTTVKDNTFTLDIINPTDLIEIDWTDVSSLIAWTDYLIKSDWDVIIKDLFNYTQTYTNNDFNYFVVKYNAWYPIAPKSLIATVSKYIGFLYSQDSWKNIVWEGLWPRSVQYETDTQWDKSKALKEFRDGLRRFIPLAIRVY